ncbi:uncharacterized protein EDB91DRAFT_1244814 [Suillus paluster]|uniref:uncharacterized protein n=1 Tax=Suillus paluster TaxID=48578 RepID=UPI001B86CB7F|nr:uncharacterized protein EDB91DRAFT_1244814 [Suillus paluster]KAG1749022.1 hypothetical protein EDB91DRAFT_1244814 [Suillus paluster]
MSCLDPLSSDCWSVDLFQSPLDDWWSLSQELSFPPRSKQHLRPFDFTPSPSSETSSSFYLSPSPEPLPIRVVCNVPLLAPRPLPYHSPTFLQFDLPDPDEDLSHPPYTHRPSKRKREDDDHHSDNLRLKRHAGVQRWAAGVHRQAYSAKQGRSHVYSATRRDRLR